MLKAILLMLVLLVPTTAAVYADDSEKDLCKANDGKWKDGGCSFKEDDGIDKEQNEVNFEHELSDNNLWDSSNEKMEDDNDNDDYKHKYQDNFGKDKGDDDYSESEAWNEKDYEETQRDELSHSDKSYSDWEYDDEEHPSLR